MAKNRQEIIRDLETGKKNAIEHRAASTGEITRLTQRAQELRNSIKSNLTPDDQKRRNRAALALVVNDLRTAQRDVQSQTVLIRRIDTEITKLKKNIK